MPRLQPSCRALARGLGIAITTIVLVFTTTEASAAIQPIIRIIGDRGVAPFAVHVHALKTALGSEDPLTVRYQWEFGDAGSDYNALTGWSAAHIYNKPGTYTIRLRITDSRGVVTTSTHRVIVASDNRKTIYVAPDGNDQNSGSASHPVRTLARAARLARSNNVILLRRNATYNMSRPVYFNQHNLRLGAYGSGPMPSLRWTAGDSMWPIVGLSSGVRNMVIEDLMFDSSDSQPDLSTVRAIHPNGVNVTIRDCGFGDVSTAMNCEQGVTGLLAQNNASGILGAYFSWAHGADHTYLGNTCVGSDSQHIIRYGGVNRSLIHDNAITNPVNSTIWAMMGNYAYISGNELESGRCIVGPNRAVGDQADRFRWAVIESNRMRREGFGVTSGGEHVMIRNNIIERDGDSAITIDGWYGDMNRTTHDVRVCNNTGINRSSTGRFIYVGEDSTQLLVANNLYMAPKLRTGTNQTANVFMLDDNMDHAEFRNNLWSNPHKVGWGNGWHYLYPHWSDASGYKNRSQWSAYSHSGGERYRTFKMGDLNGAFHPVFDAELGSAVAGIHVDFNGRARALRGKVNVGAVN